MPCCFCIKGRDGDEAIISGPMVYKCMRSYWVTDYMSNRSCVYVWGSEVTTQEPMRDNFSNRSRIARAYFRRLLHTVECLSRLVVFVSKIGMVMMKQWFRVRCFLGVRDHIEWLSESNRSIGCVSETSFLAPIRFSLCSGLKMRSTDELVQWQKVGFAVVLEVFSNHRVNQHIYL